MRERYLDQMMNDFMPATHAVSESIVSWDMLTEWFMKIAVVIVIVVIGLFIARALARVSATIVRRAKVDKVFASLGWSKQLQGIGLKIKPSTVVAWIVKWFILIALFSGVVNYLGAQQLAGFLRDVLAYLPNVIIAVVVLVVGSMVANAVRTAITSVVEKNDAVINKTLVTSVPYYAIMTITVLAALDHLGIGGNMVEILFTGIVVALSLALGIAFGLGGKDHAARALDRITHK